MKRAAIILLLICGTAFAQQKGTFTDQRDGKTYKTVKIGEQVWMAENLNYDASGSKCYDNKPANCEKYGRLYNYATAMKACPSSWHLPSNKEWAELMDFLASNKKEIRYVKEIIEDAGEVEYYSNAGKYLKAKSGWYKGGNGTDNYGFSALPSGSGSGSDFFNVGDWANWWSSIGDRFGAWHWTVDYQNKNVTLSNFAVTMLYSVRCLQDYKTTAEQNKATKEEVQETDVQQGSFTDSRDGKTYKTVKIGKQVWMAENLDYAAEGSKCYGDEPANCEIYGRLYNWNTARKSCPSGWHLPSKNEWEVLDKAVGEKVAGKKLKSGSGWNNNGNGTDEFGFSALPGGFSNSDGLFLGIGYDSYWWSAIEYNSNNAYYRIMNYNDDAYWDNDSKSGLFSVRCVSRTKAKPTA